VPVLDLAELVNREVHDELAAMNGTAARQQASPVTLARAEGGPDQRSPTPRQPSTPTAAASR
jgi:hypothetical protein